MRLKQLTFMLLLLVLMIGCSNSDGYSTSSLEDTAEKIPSNWYLRLVAEDKARAMKTESTQIGALDVEDVSVHAMKAVGTTSSSYIDIVLEDPDMLETGVYKSVFYLNDQTKEQRYRFSVITDDDTADVTLTWHGLFVLTPKDTSNSTSVSTVQ